jgi:hypothetical protein
MRHRHSISFLHVFQSWLETTDLSFEKPGTFCFIALHVALYDEPESERASRKLCAAVKRLDRNRIAVVKELKIASLQCLVRKAILGIQGNDIDQD